MNGRRSANTRTSRRNLTRRHPPPCGQSRYGVPVRECELVGMAPLEALAEAAGYYLQIPGFDSEKVIEHHLLDEDES